MAILVDTGVLYALADEDDAWHGRARAWVEAVSEILIVPVTVLPEVTYLLQTRLGPAAERRFIESIASGELEIDAVARRDTPRCLELMGRYPELGFVDVSIVAVAERLRIAVIATTDRRHFSRVRPQHVAAFELVPRVASPAGGAL
jgi:predicted nucleic acid-binding protein